MLIRRLTPLVPALLLAASATAARAQDAEPSRLSVVLRLEQGRFAVDRGASRGGLSPSKALKAVLGGTTAPLEKELFDGLDRHLSKLPRPAKIGLDAAQQKLADQCDAAAKAKKTPEDAPSPDDCRQVMALVEGVWDLTKPWAEARTIFDAWAAARGLSRLAEQLGVKASLLGDTGLSRETPLYRASVDPFDDPFAVVDPATRDDLGAGKLVFQVADPMAEDFSIAYDNFTTEADALLRPPQIRRLLRPLRDRPWVASEIQWRVKEIYGRRGLDSRVTVTDAGSPPGIRIIESARVRRIQIPAQEAKAAKAVDKILYLLLDEEDFRKVRRQGIEPRVLDGTLVLSYTEDLGYAPEKLPLLSQHQLNQATLDLAVLGFAVSPQVAAGSGPRELYRDLVVQAFAKAPSAPPATDSGSGTDSDSRAVKDLLAVSQRRSKPRTLGGGVTWRPDQGVDFLAFFRVRSTNGTQDLTLSAGGFGGAQGDVDYTGSYLGFKELHRRLSLRAKSGIDRNAQRLFGTEELDEKRRRAILNTDLEVFRNRRGASLSVSAGLRQDKVELFQGDEVQNGGDVSVLEIGLAYAKTVGETAYPWNLEVRPAIRRGVQLGDDEPDFNLLALELAYHRRLSLRLEADVRGHAGFASGSTPIFEQPSLGGGESLRGFRADTAIAERAYSVQSELWMPLVTGRRGAGGLRRFLSENVRLALFADAGEAQRSALSADGTRAGAGVGLRLDLRSRGIVLAIDWGYAVVTPVDAEKASKVYFSLRQNVH